MIIYEYPGNLEICQLVAKLPSCCNQSLNFDKLVGHELSILLNFDLITFYRTDCMKVNSYVALISLHTFFFIVHVKFFLIGNTFVSLISYHS